MDFYEKNKSDWLAILQEIFPTGVPKHCEWKDLNQIVAILNIIGSKDNSNHMFYPTGGGLDVESAKLSVENGCIEVFTGLTDILKPEVLSFESFEDARWNYFRIETNSLQPSNVDDTERDDFSEELTEITPGQYISRNYWDEGEYDGRPLPTSARVMTRYFKGAFVIFSKASPYNQKSSTYDGRHNKMSAIEFRAYIENVIQNGWK